jgi:hypothetical protein
MDSIIHVLTSVDILTREKLLVKKKSRVEPHVVDT